MAVKPAMKIKSNPPKVTANLDERLSSHQVAAIIQCNATSVNKWAEEGHIKHFKTPGGHRRFTVEDVIVFLNKHGMPLPKAWTNAA